MRLAIGLEHGCRSLFEIISIIYSLKSIFYSIIPSLRQYNISLMHVITLVLKFRNDWKYVIL